MNIFKIVVTQIFIIFGWLIFRSENLNKLFEFLENFYYESSQVQNTPIDKAVYAKLMICFSIQIITYFDLKNKTYPLFGFSYFEQMKSILRKNNSLATILGIISGIGLSISFILCIVFEIPGKIQNFIYFQF